MKAHTTSCKKETIDVPMPDITVLHWKVGDIMSPKEGEEFEIGNIAVCQKEGGRFEVRYYDIEGMLQGSQDLQLCEPESIPFLELTEEEIQECREHFEKDSFTRYYISTIQRTGRGGPFELMPKNCVYKDEFVRKNEKGEYVWEGLEAAWWGYKRAWKRLKNSE